MSERLKERVALARRCAWCLRFLVHGRWVEGRREEDDGVAPIASHTICDDCLQELRRNGLSV